MAKYLMGGKIFNTEKAVASWGEATRHDGHNYISRATGSQWDHETLFKSSKGRYYIEWTSQWQGHLPYARTLTKEEATSWLLLNDNELPDDLKEIQANIEE